VGHWGRRRVRSGLTQGRLRTVEENGNEVGRHLRVDFMAMKLILRRVRDGTNDDAAQKNGAALRNRLDYFQQQGQEYNAGYVHVQRNQCKYGWETSFKASTRRVVPYGS
jgi:hypothetical protein